MTTPAIHTATRTARSSPLDGLRALAALSVVSFHVWLYRVGDPPGPRTAWFDKVLFEANLGLICFFVLSGFLLYRSFARAALTGREPVSLKRYALRRAARIVPAYYANVLGCLLLYWAVGYSKVVPPAEHLPLFALFGQNYSMETVMKINPVTWTLCVEAAFYVLIPVLGMIAFLLGPTRIRHQAVILVGLIGLTIAWNAKLHGNGVSPLASKTLFSYVGHFAFGMLVALWAERRRFRLGGDGSLAPASTAALITLGFAVVAVHAYWHETAGWASPTRVLFANLPAALGFALVIAGAAAGSGPAVRWLSARPLVRLGVISYGIYLWHLPLILIVRQLGLLPGAFVPRLALVLPLAIGAASLSWTLLERPLIHLAASRHDRARPLRVAVAHASPSRI
jgi:peptidoglycan/LPS O-acetylase OafA/YrhL